MYISSLLGYFPKQAQIFPKKKSSVLFDEEFVSILL
jgi:hypothetical protein